MWKQGHDEGRLGRIHGLSKAIGDLAFGIAADRKRVLNTE